MNLKQHAKHLAKHEMTKQAFLNAQKGDYSDLELLFFELETHVYLKCCNQANRTFRTWKYLTPPEIAANLKDMPAPEDLNMALPRVKPYEPEASEDKEPSMIRRMVNKTKEVIKNQYSLWMDQEVA